MGAFGSVGWDHVVGLCRFGLAREAGRIDDNDAIARTLDLLLGWLVVYWRFRNGWRYCDGMDIGGGDWRGARLPDRARVCWRIVPSLL